MVDAFPLIKKECIKYGGEDRNPAVQLFGRRFFSDQTVAELLVELLLVATSEKMVGKENYSSNNILLPMSVLTNWP